MGIVDNPMPRAHAISHNSSQVPGPPGNTINASAFSTNNRFRSCKSFPPATNSSCFGPVHDVVVVVGNVSLFEEADDV